MGQLKQVLLLLFLAVQVKSVLSFVGVYYLCVYSSCRSRTNVFGGSQEEEDSEKSQSSQKYPPKEQSPKWKVMAEIVTIQSPWLKVIGERLEDDRKQLLDYWRVEKADSAIVLTLHRDRLVFPRKAYRVGLDQCTLDFPGGRVPEGVSASSVVPRILKYELGIAADAVGRVEPLNARNGWPVNSSFSNQRLFGFVAEINNNVELDPKVLHSDMYDPNNAMELTELLEELKCLQCRSILMEWLVRTKLKHDDYGGN